MGNSIDRDSISGWSLDLNATISPFVRSGGGQYGGGLDLVHCFRLGNETCFDAGAGLRIAGGMGPDVDLYVGSADATIRDPGPELIMTGVARLGLKSYFNSFFGLGLQANIGYSVIKGNLDVLRSNRDTKIAQITQESYSGSGVIGEGLLTLLFRLPATRFGFHVDAGLQSLPGTSLQGALQKDGSTIGPVFQGGVTYKF